MPWKDHEILEYAEGRTVFAYVEDKDEPIELDDGLITQDGYYWPHHQAPTRIVAVLTGGLCTSYDEEPFDWSQFKSLGTGKIQLTPLPAFIPDLNPETA